jgi:hypothetical protein
MKMDYIEFATAKKAFAAMMAELRTAGRYQALPRAMWANMLKAEQALADDNSAVDQEDLEYLKDWLAQHRYFTPGTMEALLFLHLISGDTFTPESATPTTSSPAAAVKDDPPAIAEVDN